MIYKNYYADGISERIQKRLMELGRPISWLANEMDISYPSARNYVHGYSNMNLPTFIHICEVLEVTPNWMIYGEEK